MTTISTYTGRHSGFRVFGRRYRIPAGATSKPRHEAQEGDRRTVGREAASPRLEGPSAKAEC